MAASRQATVSWQAADGNGAPITGYRIVPSTPCPSCGGLTAAGDATSSTVTGLHPGDAYSFTVVATNIVGDSDPSGPSELVTPPPEAPSAPSNVQATPGDGRASVTWDQSDPNGSTVTLYTVSASPGGADGHEPGWRSHDGGGPHERHCVHLYGSGHQRYRRQPTIGTLEHHHGIGIAGAAEQRPGRHGRPGGHRHMGPSGRQR